MRLARGQQLILRCGGTDAARQDTPPEPVKEFEAGHSRDPSNIRLLFAYRRARRVRSRLPPPPPSPADARTSGSLEQEEPIALDDVVDLVHSGVRVQPVLLAGLERIQADHYATRAENRALPILSGE